MNASNRPVTVKSNQPMSTPLPPTAGLPKASPPAQTQAARRTVRFELDLPIAWGVYVVGTFNDWKPGATPMSHVGGTQWARELALAPGRYEYRFVVDGKWIDAPKAKAYVPNSHGGSNAVLEV